MQARALETPALCEAQRLRRPALKLMGSDVRRFRAAARAVWLGGRVGVAACSGRVRGEIANSGLRR
eukprot:7895268-Alexandrium_andersonii.AAC.1